MKYLIFLFYYSLIISILIFLWSIFKSAQPEGLLFTILILPIGLYFWLRIIRASSRNASTSDSDSKAENKIATPLLLSFVILLTLFVSAFSIYSYTFIRAKNDALRGITSSGEQIKNLEASNQELNAKIDGISKALKGNNNGSSQKDVLGLSKIDTTADFIKKLTGDATASAGLGYVTIKDKSWSTLDVYEGNNLASKVVGKIRYGQNYSYFLNDKNWYYLAFDNGEGWVDGSYVKVAGNGAQQ